jgi:hypothetical protein
MVEVVLPIGQALEAIHHRPIEAICDIGKDEDKTVEIELAETGIFEEIYTRKRAIDKVKLPFWWLSDSIWLL